MSGSGGLPGRDIIRQSECSRFGRLLLLRMGHAAGQFIAEGRLFQLGDSLSFDCVQRVGRVDPRPRPTLTNANSMQGFVKGSLHHLNLIVERQILAQQGLCPRRPIKSKAEESALVLDRLDLDSKAH